MKNIEELVIRALAKTLNICDLGEIKKTDLLKEDLGLDSMSSLTFLMQLEEQIEGFLVDPDTLGIESLSSVATITAYVEEQLTRENDLCT